MVVDRDLQSRGPVGIKWRIEAHASQSRVDIEQIADKGHLGIERAVSSAEGQSGCLTKSELAVADRERDVQLAGIARVA